MILAPEGISVGEELQIGVSAEITIANLPTLPLALRTLRVRSYALSSVCLRSHRSRVCSISHSRAASRSSSARVSPRPTAFGLFRSTLA